MQYAERKLQKLTQMTATAEQEYQHLLEEAQTTKDALVRRQNTLRHAQLAYRYFKLTLEDGPLDRGQDAFVTQRYGHAVYYSGRSLLL